MKTTSFKINLRQLFLLLATVTFVLAILYRMSFKDFLISRIYFMDEEIDYNYYYEIFSYIDISLILLSFIIFFIYLLYKPIIKIFSRVVTSKFLIICILTQLLIQIVILINIKTIPISDATYYIEHGLRLAETGKYINEFGNYTAFWPIGIPALIAFFKILGLNEILLIKIINIFFSNLILIILYLYFKSLLSDSQIKLFLLIYTLNPNNILAAQPILTELPFALLSWSCLLLTLHSIKYENIKLLFFVGIIAGLCSLVKSTGLILILVIIFFIAYEKSFVLKRLILFLLAAILVIGPWAYRNYTVFNEFVLTFTNGGFNFLMGNHYNSKGGTNFYFEYDITNPNEVEEERKAYIKGINIIKNDPLRFILRLPLKLFYSYYRSDHFITWSMKKTENQISPLFKSFIFVFTNGLAYVVYILSLFYFIFSVNSLIHLKEIQLILLYFFLTIVLILVYVGSERYIFPLFPVHLFFAIKAILINRA